MNSLRWSGVTIPCCLNYVSWKEDRGQLVETKAERLISFLDYFISLGKKVPDVFRVWISKVGYPIIEGRGSGLSLSFQPHLLQLPGKYLPQQSNQLIV